jgi:hypothetical protein
VATQLVASQRVLSSIELVSYIKDVQTVETNIRIMEMYIFVEEWYKKVAEI